MRPLELMAAALLALCYLSLASAGVIQRDDIIKPKIMIISMVNTQPPPTPNTPSKQTT